MGTISSSLVMLVKLERAISEVLFT